MYVWKKAVENADSVAENVHQWLGLIDRPIILVGHSLGGRIVLKASAKARRHNVLQTYALAPAIQEEDCSFNKIRAHVEHKPALFYSENDFVLNIAYRMGEMTFTQPLGYTGITKRKSRSKTQSLDVSMWEGQPMRHNDYRFFVPDLLRDGRLQKRLDQCG